jgi:hypothetical protein
MSAIEYIGNSRLDAVFANASRGNANPVLLLIQVRDRYNPAFAGGCRAAWASVRATAFAGDCYAKIASGRNATVASDCAAIVASGCVAMIASLSAAAVSSGCVPAVASDCATIVPSDRVTVVASDSVAVVSGDRVATVSSFRVTIYASSRVTIVANSRAPAVANMAHRKMHWQVGITFRDHFDRGGTAPSISHECARKFDLAIKFDEFILINFENQPFGLRT